jgi:tRNA U34 5-methylaminomethyl-2-thiouridine-forming methyltransferase MnmC
MANSDQSKSARLTWRDDRVPVARQFDDPYFSLDDGLAETRHVFLTGNRLPDRFRDGFHIAELGFGTGLNFLAAWQAWRDSGIAGMLRFTSFEAFPMHGDDMAKALRNWPELAAFAAPLLRAVAAGKTALQTDDVHLDIVLGDARQTLPHWNGAADAWFLDGFSPAKNPELWGAELMAAVGRHTAPAGTVATYSAAGHVRQSLKNAGFEVAKVTGFGRKRHMTVGTYQGPAR